MIPMLLITTYMDIMPMKYMALLQRSIPKDRLHGRYQDHAAAGDLLKERASILNSTEKTKKKNPIRSMFTRLPLTTQLKHVLLC